MDQFPSTLPLGSKLAHNEKPPFIMRLENLKFFCQALTLQNHYRIIEIFQEIKKDKRRIIFLAKEVKKISGKIFYFSRNFS